MEMDNSSLELLRQFSQNYLNVLRGTFSGLNLVGHKDDDVFFQEQILDSVSLFSYSSFYKEHKGLPIVDMGFGGGFPLLPLGLMEKSNKIIGLEARDKKKKAVEIIAQELGLANVQTFHLRIEDLFIDTSVLFVAKAVGPCQRILENLKGNVPIHFILYKGKNFWESEEKEIHYLRNKGWSIEEDGDYVLGDRERKLILCSLDKINGPIGPKENKKLVNLSSLL